MIAVDSNLLVYAHRRDSEWHEPAAATLRELAQGRTAWAIPWPCVYEFYSIAALCLHAGVRELLTADRDFSRFPRLTTRNPLVGGVDRSSDDQALDGGAETAG